MSMFDTFLLSEPVTCPNCGTLINSVQTKEFGKLLVSYHVGDPVSHENDTRIIKEDLFCEKCRSSNDSIYIVLFHGIYIGSSPSKQEATQLLNDTDAPSIIRELGKQSFYYRCKLDAVLHHLENIINYYSMHVEERVMKFLKPPENLTDMIEWSKYRNLKKTDILEDLENLSKMIKTGEESGKLSEDNNS